MFKSSYQTIEQFKEVLLQLPENCYTKPCNALSYSTIGQHTRHIIELYQCLINGYALGEICYDKRKRDKTIEQELSFAIQQLQKIQHSLEKSNKRLIVSYELNDVETRIKSNYNREVMYNLEHMIHHQALMKVAIYQLSDILLPESFGVAPSTMQYRNQCVQ